MISHVNARFRHGFARLPVSVIGDQPKQQTIHDDLPPPAHQVA